jgi:hypothetical protein
MSADPTDAAANAAKNKARRLRMVWWFGFVAAPVAGVIAMLIIVFVIFRLPFPFSLSR